MSERAVDRSHRYVIAAHRFLDAAVAGIEAAGLTAPVRRYVSPGDPPWDGEQLCVWIDRVGAILGNPATEEITAINCLHERVISLGVLHVHCAPTYDGDAAARAGADPAREERAAVEVLRTASAVKDGIIAAWRAGEFGEPATGDLVFVDWNVVGPESGLVAGASRWAIAADAFVGATRT